jgi:hypothetical protein
MPSSSSDSWPVAKPRHDDTTRDSRGLGGVLTLLALVTGLVVAAAYFLGGFNAATPGAVPSTAPRQP